MKIQNGISLVPPSPEAQASQRDTQLREAAKMYEGHFLNEMVKAMRSTIHHEDGVLKQNFAEQIFQNQLDNQYVENWSNKGGVGLADMIYNQISEKFGIGGAGPGAKPGGGAMPLPKAMPLAPKQEPIGIPADSMRVKAIPTDDQAALEYRLEVPNPSGAAFEVQAPMAGKITSTQTLGEGWQSIGLDHGQGLKSELTFTGQAPEIRAGTEVGPGQRLANADSTRPVLAWKLERT